MFKYLRIYYCFLFSKTTIAILIFIICLLIGFLALGSSVFDGYQVMDMYRREYEELFFIDSLIIIKIISVMLSIFLTAMLHSESAINLSVYIIDKSIQKFDVYVSKLVLLIIILITYLIFVFCIYCMISIYLTPYHLNVEGILNGLIKIFMLSLFYILITSFIMTVFPNILITSICLVLFWLMETNGLKELIVASKTLNFLFNYVPHPIFEKSTFTLLGDIRSYALVYLCLIWGNSLYFVKKDIS